MNLNKHLEFIQPSVYENEIHIIGVGAVGSRVAEALVRLGFDNINIYDMDIVEDANVTNQLYHFKDIGKEKEDALIDQMKAINPQVRIMKNGKYEDQILKGAVFIAVDSIDLRREIVQKNKTNLKIDILFDGRMRLTDAQAYTAIMRDRKAVQSFLATMQFTDEQDTTPLSVCGATLSVAPTVMTLANVLVMNFLRYLKQEEPYWKVFIDMMNMTIIKFSA